MKSEHSTKKRGAARRRAALNACSCAIVGIAGASAAAAAAAEATPWLVQPAINATLSATTNGNDAPSGEERKDLFASVQPTVFLAGESPIYKIKALLGADMVAYARGSQANRIFPLLNADGTLAIVKQALFLDSSVSVRAAERDPYGARSTIGSTQNKEIVSVYRVSPNVNYDISPASNLSARYEEIMTRGDEGSATNQRFTNATVDLTRKPLPIGGSLRYESHIIRFSAPVVDEWRIETYKAVGDVKVADELVLGPVAGAERTEFAQERRSDSLYGLHLSWNPAERTRLAAEVDRRFFGTGWNVDLRHRATWFTVSMQLIREPLTSSTTLGTAPSGSALGSFLDQILTSRYPNASDRAVVVSNLIANRGLQVGQQGPVDVRATYAQLHTDAKATVVFLGTRNIVSVTAYQSNRRALVRSGDALNDLTSLTADNRQFGLALDFNRKLSPQLTLDFATNWSRIRGDGIFGDEVTREQTYRLSAVLALSPKTGMSAGVQYDRLDTSVLKVTSFRTTSAFVGLSHKF